MTYYVLLTRYPQHDVSIATDVVEMTVHTAACRQVKCNKRSYNYGFPKRSMYVDYQQEYRLVYLVQCLHVGVYYGTRYNSREH